MKFSLKTAIDGHKEAQNETGGIKTLVSDPERVFASAKLSSFVLSVLFRG
jgi:hypothetical protein